MKICAYQLCYFELSSLTLSMKAFLDILSSFLIELWIVKGETNETYSLSRLKVFPPLNRFWESFFERETDFLSFIFNSMSFFIQYM